MVNITKATEMVQYVLNAFWIFRQVTYICVTLHLANDVFVWVFGCICQMYQNT